MRKVDPARLLDVVRQVALFALVYYAYRLTRGAIDDPQGAAGAFERGRQILELERSTGLFVELHIQEWTSTWEPLLDLASWIYINAQTTIILAALVFIYAFHNERYYFVRNMLMVAMGLALVGYLLYPTAPPRFFPEWGFHDAVSTFTGVEPDDVKVNALFNPYAAMPSMHVANALLIGGALAQVSRRTPVRLLWALYPILMVWVVMATANHWSLDALAGAATAALALQGARWMAMARPRAWSFEPATARSVNGP